MEFYSVKGKRPVRLKESTRALAARALSGEFGQEAFHTPFVEITNPEYENMSSEEQYICMLNTIVTKAPLRIVPGEPFVGSATLGDAIFAQVPARYNGQNVFCGINHITVGFDNVLYIGLNGLRAQIRGRSQCQKDEKKQNYYGCLEKCIDAIELWHKRYLDELLSLMEQHPGEGYEEVYENLKDVPLNPPKNFRQALQSLWFLFAFTRLIGIWSGIGRIDKMLGGFLEDDLAKGAISIEEARELTAHFWIKGCEWCKGDLVKGSGDAQHYQNILLGGRDITGKDITNTLSYLVLDVVEELGISDFPIAIRAHKDMPESFLRRAAEVVQYGAGIIAFYDEQSVIETLMNYGYPYSDAVNFTNDGCWEVLIPGKTRFSYCPMDMLHYLQTDVLGVNKAIEHDGSFVGMYMSLQTASPAESDAPIPEYADFDELYEALLKGIEKAVAWVHSDLDSRAYYRTEEAPATALVMSLFVEGCIERGVDFSKGGSYYDVQAIHMGGVQDCANSLLAIKKMVYEEKLLTLSELITLLRNDWEGREDLRLYALNKLPHFGNDSAQSNEMTVRLLNDYINIVRAYDNRADGIKCPPGVSTFGREGEWRYARGATADGHKRGDILSPNLSPAPGADKHGATAAIQAYCSLPLKQLPGSCALDIKLGPFMARGEENVSAVMGLIKGFCTLGGYFMQMDIVDDAILKDAQLHPEKHPELAVRVSGWSARFVTLDAQWQEMVIKRASAGGI